MVVDAGLTERLPELCTVPMPEMLTESAFSIAQASVALWPAVIEPGSTVKERMAGAGLATGAATAAGGGGGGGVAAGAFFLQPTAKRDRVRASSATLRFLRDMNCKTSKVQQAAIETSKAKTSVSRQASRCVPR